MKQVRRDWVGSSSFIFVIIFSVFVVTGCTHYSKAKPGKEVDLSQPRHSYYSSSVGRLNSGAMNILYSPLELINRMREALNPDPVRGFIPGLFNGVAWTVTRLVVGIFEVVTFPLPLKPHLAEFNTDWMAA